MPLPKHLAKAPYMGHTQLEFFTERLYTLKAETLGRIHEAHRQLGQRRELRDEADLAQNEEDSRMSLRIVERETRLLHKIDAAIARIKAGDYGYCVVSGDPIGVERLLIRPTAEHSAEVKTQLDLKELHYGSARQ